MRLNKQKEYDHEKRSAESDIEKERRLTKDKSTKHKRYKWQGPALGARS